jgi:hypothetical protein
MCVKVAMNASRTAAYTAVLIVTAGLSFTGCDSDPASAIDISYNIPFISDFTVVPDTVFIDTIPVNGTILQTDTVSVVWNFTSLVEPRGAEFLAIKYRIDESLTGIQVGEGIAFETSPSGESPISVNGAMTAEVPRMNVGSYTIRFFAETGSKLTGNVLTRPVMITHANEPPYIVSVEAPDTIDMSSLPAGAEIQIIVQADDPNGVDDVLRVRSYNIQPGGRRVDLPDLIRVEPGVFRIDISIPPDAFTGTHRFHFTAIDRMNESSEEYIHEIVVK